jgi:alpha-beta hydrolase superfamily lysophospholipase|tara:strand:+ start:19 stop:780 length:762 start_codon:yes stop_codon:yes gene_type:complete
MSYKKSKYFLLPSKRRIKYLFLNKKSQITVVFFHGFMSDMVGKKPNAIQKLCKKNKIGFIKFEYSGHGRSSGKFIDGNISKWTKDAKYLIKAKTDKTKKLIFIGSSMGSWIALNLFSIFKKKIKGFIGISSAPEFLEELMWKKFNNKIKKIIMKNKIYHAERDGWTYPVTKQLILDGRKNRVLNNKNSLKIPVTLFHSLNDMVISLSFSKKILKKFKKAKKRLIRIKGGDHSLSREGDLKKICLELKKMINSV